MFTAEIDHIDKENNIYDHKEGVFDKYVPPLSTEAGDAALIVRHSKELFSAIQELSESNSKCSLLLARGTKFSVKAGPIKTAIDGDSWIVKSFEGSVEKGYRFVLIRSE